MAFGSWIKKIGNSVKTFANDFKDGFKHGWNKTKSILQKIPVVGQIAQKIPQFDNSNNPVTKYFGGDGFVTFDENGNKVDENGNRID